MGKGSVDSDGVYYYIDRCNDMDYNLKTNMVTVRESDGSGNVKSVQIRFEDLAQFVDFVSNNVKDPF